MPKEKRKPKEVTKKNHPLTFRTDEATRNLILETLNTLNSHLSFKISPSLFLRLAIRRVCLQLKTKSLNFGDLLKS